MRYRSRRDRAWKRLADRPELVAEAVRKDSAKSGRGSSVQSDGVVRGPLPEAERPLGDNPERAAQPGI